MGVNILTKERVRGSIANHGRLTQGDSAVRANSFADETFIEHSAMCQVTVSKIEPQPRVQILVREKRQEHIYRSNAGATREM